jgi:hypothetical protein
MASKRLNQLIQQIENYVECWKQFNRFVNLARVKKFSQEDDNQFLETKSVIIQELELILSSVPAGTPTKEEIHSLVAGAPSLRYLSEMPEAALRSLESQWHKIYIGWHSVLGQVKVRQHEEESKSFFASFTTKGK